MDATVTKKNLIEITNVLNEIRVKIEHGETVIMKHYFSTNFAKIIKDLGFFERISNSKKNPIYKCNIIFFEPYHARKIVVLMKEWTKRMSLKRQKTPNKHPTRNEIKRKAINIRLDLLNEMKIKSNQTQFKMSDFIKSHRSEQALRELGYFTKIKSDGQNYNCNIDKFTTAHAEKWLELSNATASELQKYRRNNLKGMIKKEPIKPVKTMKVMTTTLTLDGRRKYKLKPVTNESYIISHYQLQIKKLFGWRNVNGLVFLSIQDFNSKITIVNPKQIKLN